MVQKSVARGRQKGLPKTKKLLLVVGLLILVLAVAVFVARAQHQHTISTDKARFAQAEKDVKAVAQQIISVAGQPADQRTNNYCSRPRQKLNTGSLGCYVSQQLLYEVKDIDEINGWVSAINSLIADGSSPWLYIETTQTPSDSTTSSSLFTKINMDNAQALTNTYHDNGTSLLCDMHFVLFGQISNGTVSPMFSIEPSCGGSAKAQYYPLQD